MTTVLLLTDWCHSGVVGGAPARGKPLLAGYTTNTGRPYNIHPHYQSQCQVSPCRHRGAHYSQGVHVYSGVVDIIIRRVVCIKEIVSYVNNSEKLSPSQATSAECCFIIRMSTDRESYVKIRYPSQGFQSYWRFNEI